MRNASHGTDGKGIWCSPKKVGNTDLGGRLGFFWGVGINSTGASRDKSALSG